MDEQMDLLCGVLEALPYPVALLNRSGQPAYVNSRDCPVSLEGVDFADREDIRAALRGSSNRIGRAMLEAEGEGAWGLLEIYPVTSEKNVIGVLVLFHPDFSSRELTAEALPSVSGAMETVRERLFRLALLSSPVLILGEEGAGKHDIALALHQMLPGRNDPFIRLERGTSQTRLHRAVLESREGSLYLHRIDLWDRDMLLEIDLLLKTKQLSDNAGRIAPLLCRLMATAAPGLPSDAASGLFPPELFGRLNIMPLYIPALRERPDDIVPAASQFLKYFAQQYNKDIQDFTREARETLEAYTWPGNLPELKKCVEAAVEVCPGGLVTASQLPVSKGKTESKSLSKMRDAYTREHINAMLDIYGHSVEGKKRAAAELGVGLSTLYRILAKRSY